MEPLSLLTKKQVVIYSYTVFVPSLKTKLFHEAGDTFIGTATQLSPHKGLSAFSS